jgi:hypothetical protein
MNNPPWPLRDLVARLKEQGPQALLPELGPFVLVGSASETREPSGSWSFATKSFRIDEMDTDPAVRPRAFDMEDTVVYPLRKRVSTFAGVILVGRSTSNDVPIEDRTISKLHARIKLGPRGFHVEDAGSRNGTWLEGVRIEREVEVCAGDAIGFGSRAFRVYEAERFASLLSKLDV